MSHVLYIGVAAPLLEEAQVWRTTLPQGGAFPRSKIGAYGFSRPESDQIQFLTGRHVSAKRVEQEVKEWSGTPPQRLGWYIEPVSPVDHRQVVAALKKALQDAPVRVETHIGLTLQQLQRDLMGLHPELVLLYCHGTEDGCLLFEDGCGRAEFVPGERLFPLFRPRPRVLFLNACHSEAVLKRAKGEAESKDSALVYIAAETPVEVGASAAFQAMFYTALLQGESVGDAFESAQQYVANDRDFGDLSVASDEVPPSQKFRLDPSGQSVCLSVPTGPVEIPSAPAPPPRYRKITRTSERFVGRRRDGPVYR